MHRTQQIVAIKNARFFAPIGYYEEEQILGNEFFVDTEVRFPFSKMDTEKLENTLNYEELYQLLVKVMTPKRKLLESAAEEILNELIEKYPQTSKAIVSIRKTNPPFGGDTSMSEVSLEYESQQIFTM